MNIAFKCNYCDGGKNSSQVGFCGVCSDKMIKYNVDGENGFWCHLKNSLCWQYRAGIITRRELDGQMEERGFVCYESQIFRDWKVYAGVYEKGEKAGMPKTIRQAKIGNLGVITTREPYCEEEKRYICGVFLIDEVNEEGDDNNLGGYVCANNDTYRLTLSFEEAHQMPFWKYYANENRSQVPQWGSGLFRYFDNDIAVQILRDIVKIKTKSSQKALKFLNHFAEIHRIHIDDVPEPSGALTHIK